MRRLLIAALRRTTEPTPLAGFGWAPRLRLCVSVSSPLKSTVTQTRNRGARREGSALLIVLVVIMLITLSAYTYTQTMQTEFEAAISHSQDVQVRQAADSGVDYVATLLARRSTTHDDNLLQNPALFQAVSLADTQRDSQRVRFSIVAPVEADPYAKRIRYGLVDESAKLNLNLLDQLQKDLQLDDDEIADWLLKIPGMTRETVDAIRDWIDADTEKRPSGAESEAYQSLKPPYSAKNGPLETLDELLLVRGVTAQLLYGEDANRNGLLDPSENDGDASPPFDNADGVLNHGWSAFFTVHSRERNLRADGQPRINLNNGLLTDLYDQLEKEFDEETAKFVIAYRINGPKPKTSSSANSKGGLAANSTSSKSTGSKSTGSVGKAAPGGAQSTKPTSGGSSGGTAGSSPTKSPSSASSTPKPSSDQQTQQALMALTQQIAQAMFQKGGQVTRGGIDLSRGGPNKIKSIFDLIGSEVQATVKGASQTLTSPWPAEPSQLQSLLPKLSDVFSLSDDDQRSGRININQARPEILLGIPNMSDDLVQSIVAAQSRNSDGIPSPDVLRRHSTAGWLFLDGLVDLETMRKLDPYLTARGDVYRAQVLGFYDGPGPVHRQEAIVDATRIPPRIVWQRDLNELGRGYQKSQLLPEANFRK